MMTSQWLQQRLNHLIPQLEDLSKAQEADIHMLCQGEIASWRSRPTIRKKSSLAALLMGARMVIREQLPVREDNCWFNPKRAEWEHLALKYLNFSETEWMEIQQSRINPLKEPLAHTYRLSQPDAITQKAATLLTSPLWPEITVGLTLSTGRSFLQIMKTGQFQDKTTYSLLFSAPYKRQDRIFAPQEIPTLVPSSLVLAGITRLRRVLDCSSMEGKEINFQYRSAVCTAAYQHFLPLILIHPGTDDIYIQLARAIYPCLATYYYCPSSIEDFIFIATILGHYWLLEAPSPEQQRTLAQTSHYFDYHLDPTIVRKGIRLTEPQVEVLEAFKKEEFSMTTHQSLTQEPILSPPMFAESEPGMGAVLHLRPQTLQRFYEVASELGIETHEHDTLLSILLNIYTKYRQLSFAQSPLASEHGSPENQQDSQEGNPSYDALDPPPIEDPEEPNQNGPSAPQLAEDSITLICTHFHFSDAFKTLICDALASSQDHDFRTFLQRALEKEAQVLLAQANQPQEKDFSHHKTSQLVDLDDPLATQEYIRRAVYTIVQHNIQADPASRWYIHARTIQQLTESPFPPINDYLRKHQAEITSHHTCYHISLACNRKEQSIEEMLSIAEAAEAFSQQELLLHYTPSTEEKP